MPRCPRGVARDFGVNHQRFRDPVEEGTLAVPSEGVDSPTQAKMRPAVSPAAQLLYRAVRREGPGHGHAGS